MHETRTEAEVLESMGCAETPEQALAFMGLDRVDFAGLSPIRRLQLAIVQEAIYDALADRADRIYGCWTRGQVLAWISAPYESGDELADLSTFEGCCHGVGLDPDYLRRLILSAPVGPRRRWMNRRSGASAAPTSTRKRRAA